MATVKGVNPVVYCDDVYQELTFIKNQIAALKDTARQALGTGSEMFKIQDRHLTELVEYVDWKLQLLTKACPFEWKATDEDIDYDVSVQDARPGIGPDFSGGYVGG